jgi:stage II sporulation protein AA (anti-sigma F factor antagonist)
MITDPGIMTDYKVNGSSNLSVWFSEKREGFFIIQPVGSINAITSPILQDEVKQIIESKPEIILFDMKQVSYINSKGLHVILKAHQEMKFLGGRVVLVNLQPHIKEVFDIIDALPAQRIFASRHELDNYLDTMQKSYFDYSYINEFEAGTDNYKLWAKSNSHQGLEMISRM